VEHEPGSGQAAPVSPEALAASLKAMEGLMGEISRSLGALRPAAAVPAQREVEAAPPLRPRDEASPPRPDMAGRSQRRRVGYRSVPRENDLILPAACCEACAQREARHAAFCG
jgi:hypothetical protein